MNSSFAVQPDKVSAPAALPNAPLIPKSPGPQESLRVSDDAADKSPETPRLQLLQAASAPPPVLQRRRFSLAPRASHPVLAAAFAKTGKADASASQQKAPTRRQLDTAFARAASLPDPDTPFAFAPHAAHAQLLSDQLDSLPSPEEALQQVLAKDAAFPCQLQQTPSGLLTTLLDQINLLGAGSTYTPSSTHRYVP